MPPPSQPHLTLASADALLTVSFLPLLHRYTLGAQDLVMRARGVLKDRGWRISNDRLGSGDDISVYVIPLIHGNKLSWKRPRGLGGQRGRKLGCLLAGRNWEVPQLSSKWHSLFPAQVWSSRPKGYASRWPFGFHFFFSNRSTQQEQNTKAATKCCISVPFVGLRDGHCLCGVYMSYLFYLE